MSNDREVNVLFDGKAGRWHQKYQPGGPLTSRVTAFCERLARLAPPNARVLDLGCGTGAIAAALASRGFGVAACDAAGQMIEVAKQMHPASTVEWFLLPEGWKRLPFESGAFDGIIASSVFEYLADLDMVLAECQRALKPGGYLIATVPNSRNLMRRLERVVRPAAMLAMRVPVLNRIARLRSYAAYLKCSRNRMSLDEWFIIGRRKNFTVVEEAGNAANGAPLVFLVLRKTNK